MNVARRRCSLLTTALFAAVAITLTGCSIDTQGTLPSSSGDIAGIIHGGPNPVAGATVSLYATGTTGYGSAATRLATTTSDSNGNFSFNSFTYTCPGGSYAYVTSAGGNTGANTANANSLLMAAIGPCSGTGGLTRTTQVWVDELSTVAAAYALGNFMSISGTGATATVNIGATANNNATSGSCTVVSGVTTSCVAAGLNHAFLNAANLVNAAGTVATPPTGLAYASPPLNSTTSATAVAAQNVVPQQLINVLGNVLQACVNSTGASGTNACATLFANTTPPSTIAASPITPSNTLQAMVNLAKYPFLNTANIYGIAQSSGFYQPTLTSAPGDFTIAIIWRSYAAGLNQMGSVYYTTLDSNDNVYATALTAPSTGSIAGTAPFVVNALTSNGTGIWAAPATISTVSTNVCSAYGGTALLDPPCEAATDALGNLWVANGQADSGQSGSYTAGYLAQVNTSTGAVTQFTLPSPSTDFPLAVAVDKSNDLFFSTSNNSGTNLWKLPQGSTSATAPTAVTFAGTAYASSHTLGSIAFDTAGDIFGSHNAGGGIGFSYGPNTATFPAETFGTLSDCNYCSADGLNEGINSEPSSTMVDASGNFWFEGKNGLMEMSAASAASQTGAVNFPLGNSSTVLRLASMDGAGTIFVPDANVGASANSANPQGPPVEPSPVLRIFYPAFSSVTTLNIGGCNTGGATGNTTCITANSGGANNQLFYQAFNPAIDSTGSLWISSGANDGVIQIIGLAAPTWPQVSYLHPAVMP